MIVGLAGSAHAELDPRGDWNLAWTAPGPIGEVAAYELRLSFAAPGSDLEAWWSSAESQMNLPTPGASGTVQTWLRRQLTPGQAVYAAIRARNVSYEWSPVSNVVTWTPTAAPLVQEVTPTLTAGGSQSFVVRGLAVASASAVRLHRPGGQVINGTAIAAHLDGSLSFSALLPDGVTEHLDLEVVTPGGTDILRGWLEVGGSQDPPPAVIQPLVAVALSSSIARITWTAPTDVGPQGTGPAAQYELRRLGGTPDAWSWESGVAIPTPVPGTPGASESVTVTGLPEGSLQAFAIRSADGSGNWSATSAVATVDLPDPYVPPTDDMPPQPVTDLAGVAIDAETLVLTWTAPADNSPWGTRAISRYELRQLSGAPGNWSWAGGSPLVGPSPRTPGKAETFVVRDLEPEAIVAFAVAGVDSSGNMASPSNYVEVDLPEVVINPDSSPPATVNDLVAESAEPGMVRLTWTAPADEGPTGTRAVAAYDLRRMAGTPGAWSWDGGLPLDPTPPLAPGAAETLLVSGLAPGETVAFAVASVDSAGLWSSISEAAQVTVATPPDTLGPEAVGDLAAELAEDGSVSLVWTVPTDGEGSTASYEFRSAETSGDEFSWATATTIPDAPTPGTPGVEQTWTGVLSVAAGEVATVVMRSADESGNLSPLSNPVTIDRTGEDVTPPGAPLEFEAQRNGSNSVQLRWRAPGDDALVGRATQYELCVVAQPELSTEWWRSVEPQVLVLDPKNSGKREVCNQRGLSGGVVYGFALRAVDDAGWGSEWVWVLLEVDGGTGIDTAPPLPVEGTRARTTSQGVEITWSAAPEADVVAYRIHRKEPGRERQQVGEVSGSVLAFIDLGIPPAGTAYAVTAVDADGNGADYWQWVGIDALPGSPNVTLSRQGGGWLLSVLPESPPPAGGVDPTLQIFDVAGRLIADLEAIPDADGWTARWDGRTRSGRGMASGVFFLRIRTETRAYTQKLLMTR